MQSLLEWESGSYGIGKAQKGHTNLIWSPLLLSEDTAKINNYSYPLLTCGPVLIPTMPSR